MTAPITDFWAPSASNTTTIASRQSTAAGGNVILNSNMDNPNERYAYPFTTTTDVKSGQVLGVGGPYIFKGVARTIYINKFGTGGVIFTVTGIGVAVDSNGNPTGNFGLISEGIPIAGPAGQAVSTNIWKQINSITTNTAGNDFQIGFGPSGITNYRFMDSNRTYWAATYQAQVLNRTDLNYAVWTSLTKPETPTHTEVLARQGSLDVFPAQIYANPVLASGFANAFGTITGPVAMIWTTIGPIPGTPSAPPVPTNDSFYFTTLQQGTRS